MSNPVATPRVVIRCKFCQQHMTMVAIPHRSVAAGCDGCPADTHLHVRCEQCSPKGAYACMTIKRDGSLEALA